MSRRTQVTLTDEQYERLIALSRSTGLSLAELVRRALDRAYAGDGTTALEASFGAWKGRRVSGERYVERLRRGLSRRVESAGGGAR